MSLTHCVITKAICTFKNIIPIRVEFLTKCLRSLLCLGFVLLRVFGMLSRVISIWWTR